MNIYYIIYLNRLIYVQFLYSVIFQKEHYIKIQDKKINYSTNN